MSLKQPGRHERLTTYAIIRWKTHGERFEIACHKDKVLDWRRGLEHELGDVLAVDTIFIDASKGICASEVGLRKVFGTADARDIARILLKHGRQQFSVSERGTVFQALFRSVIQVVVERCVHPPSGRSLTASVVENALRKTGFSVQMIQAAKVQGLRAVDILCKAFPSDFARAQMRAKITLPSQGHVFMRDHLISRFGALIESDCRADGKSDHRSVTFSCDPSHYREVDALVSATHAHESMTLLILSGACANDGELPHGANMVNNLGTCGAPMNPAPVVAHELSDAPLQTALRCSTCQDFFEDSRSFRFHCQTEWHNFNLKQKLAELGPVSIEEYELIRLRKSRV